MINRIKSFFVDHHARMNTADPRHTIDEFHLAAAALLVHAALVDAHFGDDERATIIRLIESRLELTPDEAQALFDAGHAGQILHLPDEIGLERRKTTVLICRSTSEPYQIEMNIPGTTPIPNSDYYITTEVVDISDIPDGTGLDDFHHASVVLSGVDLSSQLGGNALLLGSFGSGRGTLFNGPRYSIYFFFDCIASFSHLLHHYP